MPAIEKGRVCFLSRGRKAGEKGVIAEINNDNTVTVIVDGKKKKTSIRHIFPVNEKGEIKLAEKKPVKEEGK